MKQSATMIPFRYDPRLVEEATFLAMRDHAEEHVFHAERDQLYGLTDHETRDRAFQHYHAAWFTRLGLGAPVEQAFAEQPSIVQAVRDCVVGRAPGRKEEGAELFVAPPEEGLTARERRSVGLLLQPESLLASDPLLGFLRHELLHIADMLNSDFAYEPALPQSEGGPMYDRMLRDRYRVLWDTTIDGRLVRRGWAPSSVRERCLRDFAKAFPMLGVRMAEEFARFFDTEPHTHAELVAFACNPGGGHSTLSHSGRCPLCRFPTYTFAPEPERLPAAVIAQITQDFPAWQPSQSLCLQCADLYRARILQNFSR